ncbi:MAG: mechanosensitive ion channel [Alphaproteobacteria bacterium]|nr:mechanosensitive ion channel [Alphaproteobacteria bacterium]
MEMADVQKHIPTSAADISAIPAVLGEYISIYGLKILGALAIFLVGKWVVGLGVRFVQRLMEKAGVDKTLRSFGGNILHALGLAVVILAVLGQVGVQTASLVAVLGAAGLAVGLALQGSLSNFAAGVMIILFRPFRVGDYIEAASVAGSVHDLSIFTTTLTTPDNKTVIVPNANITSSNIINYSAQERRRVDLVFGIGYGDDIKKAKEILTRLVKEDPRVLAEPEPVIAVAELGDSSVNFWVRPWVKTSDFWPFKFEIVEKVKLAFDAEGVTIPFPQRDVHLHASEQVISMLEKKKAA